jgi:hypothetical protein
MPLTMPLNVCALDILASFFLLMSRPNSFALGLIAPSFFAHPFSPLSRCVVSPLPHTRTGGVTGCARVAKRGASFGSSSSCLPPGSFVDVTRDEEAIDWSEECKTSDCLSLTPPITIHQAWRLSPGYAQHKCKNRIARGGGGQEERVCNH